MPTSTLRLLGPFSLQPVSGGGAPRFGRKAQALLAYLAVRGSEGATRAALISLLWADHGAEEARNALRQCLHQARRVLGSAADLLEVDGERLAIRASACAVDVRCFEQLASRDDCESLLGAARLYRAALAQGLEAGGEFDHWLRAERQRLAAMAHGVLGRLAEIASTPGECEEAMSLAHRLLADDPVHEGCYRSLMRLHDKCGQRAKALRVWEDCCRVLRAELNVAPCPQTRALYEKLRATPGEGAPDAGTHGWPQLISRTADRVAPAMSPGGTAVVDHLLRGWQLFSHYRRADNLLARAAFEAAVALAPDHPQAISLLGFTHFFDFLSGWTEDPSQGLEMAAQIAQRALAAGAEQAAPHTLQGKILLWRMQHDAALEEMQRALMCDKTSAYAHFHLADASVFAGRTEEALRLVRRALQLDGNDHGMFLTIEGFALFLQGDLPGARTAGSAAVTRNPAYPWAYGVLCAALYELGDLPAATAAAATGRQLNRRLSVEFARNVFPIRDPRERARLAEAWRASGMPEHEG